MKNSDFALMINARNLIPLLSLLLLNACGASKSESNTPEAPTLAPVTENYDLRILFIGNSHSASNGLRNIVAELIEQQQPQLSVKTAIAPRYGYLAEHLDDTSTISLFESEPWTRVVLQAQKYSQSKVVNYPTDAAEKWILKTKNQGGTPVLFPEWGQLGRDWEGQYVFELHQQIAQREPACVAPIGPAWDTALMLRPELQLHAVDGNHASLAGSFLTALVIAETISRQSVDLLPHLATVDISEQIQDFLGQVASQTMAESPECVLVTD